MKKRNSIMLMALVVAVILLIILNIIFALFAKYSTSKKELSKDQLTSFSQSFIKDYSTYSYSNASDYNNRLKKYIAPAYLNTFSKKYLISDFAKKNKLLTGLSSSYSSSSINIVSLEKTEANVNVQYIAVEKNSSTTRPPKNIKRVVSLVVKKINNQMYITYFGFSVVK